MYRTTVRIAHLCLLPVAHALAACVLAVAAIGSLYALLAFVLVVLPLAIVASGIGLASFAVYCWLTREPVAVVTSAEIPEPSSPEPHDSHVLAYAAAAVAAICVAMPADTVDAAPIAPSPVAVESVPVVEMYELFPHDQLVEYCRSRGIKANKRWKRETMLERLRSL